MNGAEVALIIFIIILVLVGLGVGIYFLWKHDQKKQSSGGAGGGTDDGIKTPFSIIPVVSGGGSYLVAYTNPKISFGAKAELPINVGPNFANLNQFNCSSFSWQFTPDNNLISNLQQPANYYSNGINGVPLTLVWSPSISSEFTKRSNNLTALTQNPPSDSLVKWKYDKTNKTFCSIDKPEICLFIGDNPDAPLQTVPVLTSGTLPSGDVPQKFQFDLAPALTPAGGCFA